MTRAEAIRRLESMATDLTGACVEAKSDKVSEYIARKIQAVDMAIAALKEQDVTDKNVGNKWISVKERLPEYDRKVLVTDVRDGYISTGELMRHVEDYWYCEDEMRLPTSEITHWMYLPEPPKEDAVK